MARPQLPRWVRGPDVETLGQHDDDESHFSAGNPYEYPYPNLVPVPFWMPELPGMRSLHYDVASRLVDNTSGFHTIGIWDLTVFVGASLWSHPWRFRNKSEAMVWYIPARWDICPSTASNECTQAYSKMWLALQEPAEQKASAVVAPTSRCNRMAYKQGVEKWNYSHFKLTVEDYSRWGTYPRAKTWIAVPYVSSYLLLCDPPSFRAGMSLAGQPRRRTIACLAGKRPWRMTLLVDCEAHPAVETMHVSETNSIKLYETTTFSFQPTGDSYIRKAIFDALGAGNIPIIFRHAGVIFVPVDDAIRRSRRNDTSAPPRAWWKGIGDR